MSAALGRVGWRGRDTQQLKGREMGGGIKDGGGRRGSKRPNRSDVSGERNKEEQREGNKILRFRYRVVK